MAARLSCVFAALMLFVFTSFSVTLTIDEAQRYQTIEGFGAHGGMNVWWSNSDPFTSAQWIDWVVNDLGLTMTRNEYYPNGADFQSKQREFLLALKSTAEAAGEPMRYIATFWSPPGSMKANGTATCAEGPENCYLLPGMYTGFGHYSVSAIDAYADIGIDLYALSLQNEPLFAQYFNSCVYTSETYLDMVKVVGPIVKQAHPNVKLFGMEGMLASAGQLEARTFNDAQAGQYMDIMAVHGYSDGVNPLPGSTASMAWDRGRQMAEQFGAPLWMTETSGYSNDWTGGFGTAQAIYQALKYGHVSAWVWWQLSGTHTAGEILMPGGNRGKLYYAAKQYFRYVRPGAVMIDIQDNVDQNVAATAFHHSGNRTITIVVQNYATSTTSIDFSGGNLPAQLRRYVSSGSKDCVDEGTVSSTGSISLDARSVTTFVGENYDPPIVSNSYGIKERVALMENSAVTVSIYTVDGRLAGTLNNIRMTAAGNITRSMLSNAGINPAGQVLHAVIKDSMGNTIVSRNLFTGSLR